MHAARLVWILSVLPSCSVEAMTSNPTPTRPPDAGIELQGCAGSVPVEDGVVMTDRGAVRGARVGDSYAFKGIPFAAPPVGALRWRPPAPAACWSGVRDGTQFGSACVQRKTPTSEETIGDEDCLTLNVWRPAEDTGPLPVLVFIHGGAHVSGASSQQSLGVYLYDGQYLAEHGPAVVVTLNYRLGSLGYLVHPSLSSESEHTASGNYGTLDQIAALTWVRDNIAAFGGDPSKVLLFGQSAGAIQTCMLLTSPLAAGLFSRALMLSGHCVALPHATAEAAGLKVAERLGCSDASDVSACLRSQSASAVTTTPVTFGAGTADAGYNASTVDGWVLPRPPIDTITQGLHNHMPIIMSTTADEYTTQLGLYAGTKAVATEAQYEAEIHAIFGTAIGDKVLNEYPATQYESPLWALVAALSDLTFTCRTRDALRAAASSQSEPLWRPVFAHRFEGGPLAPYRAGHGFDLLFGFHVTHFDGYAFSPDELQLADFLSLTWTHFALTGEPNATTDGPWAIYRPENDNFLTEDEPISTGAGVRTAQCDFWDQLEP